MDYTRSGITYIMRCIALKNTQIVAIFFKKIADRLHN